MSRGDGGEMRISRSFTKVFTVVTLFTASFGFVIPSASWANTISATSPAQNAVISTTPNVVSITTDEPLVDQGTSIQVIDPNGNEVDDHSITVSGSTAVIGMQTLTTSGAYKVLYNLYFASNSPLIGNYSFTFNSPGSISQGTGNGSNSNSNSNSNQSNNSSNSNSGNQNSNNSQNSSSNSHQPNLNANSGNSFIYGLMLSALIVALALLWYAYVLINRSRRQSKTSSRSTRK